MNATLRGTPDAGNPHVRFDEGEFASAKPRRGSLLYKKLLGLAGAMLGFAALTAEAALGNDRTWFLVEIPLSSTYSNGNTWLGWSGRWTDYPLNVDRSLPYEEGKYNQASLPDFAKTLEKVAAFTALDGITYNADRKHFYEYYFRQGLLDRSPVLIVPNYQFRSSGATDEPFFAEALANPKALKIAGKTVITSYFTGRRHTPEQLKTKLDFLRAKYGDRFLFVASVDVGFSTSPWPHQLAETGKITPEEIERAKANFRRYLRVADGLCLEGILVRAIDGELVADYEMTRIGLLEPFVSVVNEPEFKGQKLVAVNVGTGHANPHHFGNRRSANGTKTLRDSLETMLKCRPDIVTFFEWDEWNENTMIKPTLWTSYANRRVIRAERDRYEGIRSQPFPGDDVAVPNLIVSMRKTLTLGELARYEILSVPDASTHGHYEVSLTLKDEAGKVLKEFPGFVLEAETLAEKRLAYASEDAGNAYAIVPEIKVKWQGREYLYGEGLPWTELRPTTTWDRKWVLMPLRDLAAGASCRLKLLGEDSESGMVEAEAKGVIPKGIDRLEITEGGEIVYTTPGHPEEEFREDADHVVFSCWNTLGRYTKEGCAHLTLGGVGSAEWLIGTNRTRGSSCRLVAQAGYTPDTYLRVHRSGATKGVLTLDWPEGGKLTIPLAKVMASGVYALAGPTNQLVFGVRRYLKQPYYPSPVDREQVLTRFEASPDLPVTVMGAHVIGKDGKLWRSLPVVAGKRSGARRKVRVFSLAKGRAVDVEVDAERVPDLKYDLSGERTGIVVGSGFGRAFDGTLGCSTALATMRIRGSSSFVHVGLIDEASRLLPKWAPEQVVEDGEIALRFTGTGTYFTMPPAVLPQNAAYRLSFEFKPDGDGEGMEVFSTGSGTIFGNLAWLKIVDGKLTGLQVNMQEAPDTFLESVDKVVPKAWNRVEVICDVDSLELILNGRSSGKRKCVLPARYDTSSWFGGRKGALFRGYVRRVELQHAIK